MRNVVKSSFSEYGNPSRHVVDEEEIRDWLGLYSDSSEDELLLSLLRAGERKIAKLTNGLVPSRIAVKDYFVDIGKRMLVSSPIIQDGDITLRYYGTDNSLSIVESSLYFLDTDGPNGKNAVVYVGSDVVLSSYRNFPVVLDYETGGTGIDELRVALREYVWTVYNSRNQEDRERINIDSILIRILSDHNLGIS